MISPRVLHARERGGISGLKRGDASALVLLSSFSEAGSSFQKEMQSILAILDNFLFHYKIVIQKKKTKPCLRYKSIFETSECSPTLYYRIYFKKVAHFGHRYSKHSKQGGGLVSAGIARYRVGEKNRK